MENQNLKTLPLIHQSNTYDLIIPEKVEDKIRYLCQQVWNTEWSGILFYNVGGSFKDNSLVITCEDIFPMDIGNSTYTEFDMSPDVASYIVNNPELIECHTGLIHSHNSMPTFFSGTDINTLKQEGAARNHFVSLIVNNVGKYSAAITKQINTTKYIEEHYTYNTFQGEKIVGIKKYNIDTTSLEYFDLNIIIEKKEDYSKKAIYDRLEEIRESKKVKTQVPTVSNTTSSFKSQFNNLDNLNLELPFDNTTIKADKNTVKSIVMQLLTGSIIVTNNNKIDIDLLVNNMERVFDKRFGKGEEGFSNFKIWADGYVEYLCWFVNDEALKAKELIEDEIASLYAIEIINELEKLPKNKYIEEYINILGGYLI